MDLPSMRIEPIDYDNPSVPSRKASFVIASIESALTIDFLEIQNYDYYSLIYV